VRIDGDNQSAQRFSKALASLDIDWEEQLSHVTGDIAAHEIGRGVRAALHEGRRVASTGRENLSEYLTEEARLLPHRLEIEDFLAEIDTLRDDSERLAARIALLEKRHHGDKT
jgi:ubiquinone biosynthesis protein UbiJ